MEPGNLNHAEKTARAMLGRMDLGQAKNAAKNAELIGKKLPPVRLELLDGKVYRSGELVTVFGSWVAMDGDAVKPLLAAMKTLQDKYKKHPEVAFIGVNINAAGDKTRVLQAIRDGDVRWPTYFDGKPLENALTKSLGLSGQVAVAVVLADQRIAFVGGAGDTPTAWAINAGLRMMEKKHARPVPSPGPAPRTTQPVRPDASPRPLATPGRQADKLDDMLKLAESYRSAKMTEKADEVLRQLIRDHPDSPQAAKARELLAGP